MTKEITDEAYEVEKICGYRQSDGKYLVKWVGYEEPTWEDVDLLSNCREPINEFWENENSKEHTESVKVTDPPDFRLTNELPFEPKDSKKECQIQSYFSDLSSQPIENNFDDEPRETSLFDLQRPPNFLFLERSTDSKWQKSGREIFNEPSTPGIYVPQITIENIYEKEIGESKQAYVQLKDARGNVEEFEFDLIYSMFPNSVFEYFNCHFPNVFE